MDTKNIILATALSVGILLLWSVYFDPPMIPEETATIQQSEVANSESNLGLGTLDESLKIIEEPEMLSVEDSISDSPRIEINTPGISGSIRLNGLIIDDITLKAYQETLDKDSANIRFLSHSKPAMATRFHLVGYKLRIVTLIFQTEILRGSSQVITMY